MTTTNRAEKARLRRESEARIQAAQAATRQAVERGACPLCGSGISQNLALTGWVQCDQHGDGHFRKDPNKPRCSWQGFTHG